MDDDTSANEPSTMDDGLVLRAKTERAAFGLLYDRYYPRVARYCLRRLFDRSAAEDVTSEAFLQVASHLRKFPGQTETDFRCWLFRIASNAVNACLRQSRRRQELWEAAARSSLAESGGGSHHSSAEHELLDWPVVYRAILELDDRDQTIITLRFFADCSHEEIATIVDATPGAVRTALSRTLARLRERFQPRVPRSPSSSG
jgi:RNA polymerase sigma-70 factor (ECF subfamily)